MADGAGVAASAVYGPVGVCVPFRARNRHETDVAAWCTARWQSLGWRIYLGDRPGRFNRAAARNDAADRAVSEGCQVLVFANADTVWMDSRDVTEAARIVAKHEMWALPDRYVEAHRDCTLGWLAGTPLVWEREVTVTREWREWPARSGLAPPAGPQMIPARWWGRLRWDERFGAGWGYEDAAFRELADGLLKRHTRMLGTAVHLWHERSSRERPSDPAARRNRDLYRRYYRGRDRAGLEAARALCG